MTNYIVTTVSSISERDKLVKRIYTNLTKEPSTTFTVVQDQVNRIKVLHDVDSGIKVCIRTYIVIVLPIICDLTPLGTISGDVTFHLDETIDKLNNLIKRLQAMQGRRIVKENSSSNFREILESLSGDKK